tara:strand:- start:118 stop:705 length:588 start_codon:yes stop_codon:yes gene_type:complete
MTKQANVDLDLFIKKQLLGPEKPGRLYRQHQRQRDFRERINPRTENIAHSLRITPYLKAGNDGPSTPVRVYDGKVLPNFGGGRIGKVRPKKIASIPLGERERNAFQWGMMMNTHRDKLNAINTEKALSKGLKIAQATLGEQIQRLAGDSDRRAAPPWWQSGWKSESEAIEVLKNNPELIQHFDNQPGFPKDLFKQ